MLTTYLFVSFVVVFGLYRYCILIVYIEFHLIIKKNSLLILIGFFLMHKHFMYTLVNLLQKLVQEAENIYEGYTYDPDLDVSCLLIIIILTF